MSPNLGSAAVIDHGGTPDLRSALRIMFAIYVGFYSLTMQAKNRSSLQIGSTMLSGTSTTSLIASSPEILKMKLHARFDIRPLAFFRQPARSCMYHSFVTHKEPSRNLDDIGSLLSPDVHPQRQHALAILSFIYPIPTRTSCLTHHVTHGFRRAANGCSGQYSGYSGV